MRATLLGPTLRFCCCCARFPHLALIIALTLLSRLSIHLDLGAVILGPHSPLLHGRCGLGLAAPRRRLCDGRSRTILSCTSCASLHLHSLESFSRCCGAVVVPEVAQSELTRPPPGADASSASPAALGRSCCVYSTVPPLGLAASMWTVARHASAPPCAPSTQHHGRSRRCRVAATAPGICRLAASASPLSRTPHTRTRRRRGDGDRARCRPASHALNLKALAGCPRHIRIRAVASPRRTRAARRRWTRSTPLVLPLRSPTHSTTKGASRTPQARCWPLPSARRLLSRAGGRGITRRGRQSTRCAAPPRRRSFRGARPPAPKQQQRRLAPPLVVHTQGYEAPSLRWFAAAVPPPPPPPLWKPRCPFWAARGAQTRPSAGRARRRVELVVRVEGPRARFLKVQASSFAFAGALRRSRVRSLQNGCTRGTHPPLLSIHRHIITLSPHERSRRRRLPSLRSAAVPHVFPERSTQGWTRGPPWPTGLWGAEVGVSSQHRQKPLRVQRPLRRPPPPCRWPGRTRRPQS